MNACTAMPVAIPLQRPLWRRVADWAEDWMTDWSAGRLAAARSARPPASVAIEPIDLRHALALNDHLLRDIGVSEALRDEAAALRGIERMAAHIAIQDFARRGRHWYG